MIDSAPFELLADAVRRHGSPLWAYDAKTIIDRIENLQDFDTVRYAQKANPNVHILRLMRARGLVLDAVSLGEIERALAAGASFDGHPAGVVLTCDVLDQVTLARVIESRIEVNAGSIDMLRQLGERSPGHRVWIRINPGFGHGHSRKTNTGGENSKHGIWHEQLGEALDCIRTYDLHLVGVHMHIGSGVDYEHLEQVARSMIELVGQLDRNIEAFSIGGGLSVPYRRTDTPVDIQRYARTWAAARKEIEEVLGHSVRMEIEPGRYLIAEAGYLVTEVRAVKQMGRNTFILVDAGFNDLMRPALYGSYHRMTLLDANGIPVSRPLQPTMVAGPLCESGDVFTQDEHALAAQDLPQARVGDLLVIHDSGAYGASMSSNYNSRPLLPEVLIENASFRMIRRRQDIQDLLNLELCI
ncbi:diaminopimelate decarboxylase [Pseudomonas donghuensis]|uniref:diaminopimelate decarboxylase n=1 Tax=Pseudomonas donghuensis TaxID=1163398 RepID=UPI0020C21525|nr:diaminopimelate decarboxylase [Pseudomonas donghuensis]MCP6696362.1 diaminopimelate decarboxylase [Pseudomonas donghuensis]